MQKLSALKTITDILFYLSFIPVIFGIPFLIVFLVAPHMVPFDVNFADENMLKATDGEKALFILLIFICYLFYMYALYVFRQLLGLFKQKIFFSDRISEGFNLIGKLIINGYLTYVIGYFVLSLFTIHDVEINIGLSILYALGAGYFFIVLGSIFKMAKQMKEENELTI